LAEDTMRKESNVRSIEVFDSYQQAMISSDEDDDGELAKEYLKK